MDNFKANKKDTQFENCSRLKFRRTVIRQKEPRCPGLQTLDVMCTGEISKEITLLSDLFPYTTQLSNFVCTQSLAQCVQCLYGYVPTSDHACNPRISDTHTKVSYIVSHLGLCSTGFMGFKNVPVAALITSISFGTVFKCSHLI